MTAIDVVVFDMGGVVVRLGSLEELLAGGAVPADEFWPRWLASPTVRAFERGDMEVERFGLDLVAEMGLDMSGDELVERFARFPTGLYPGAEAMVAAVPDGIETAVLSNTNALHWDTQPDAGILRSMFDRCYLSYRIGLVKPDREVYDHVAADLDINGDRILFLDDNSINVEGARAAGWRAEVAKGPVEAADVLRAYGVVDVSRSG